MRFRGTKAPEEAALVHLERRARAREGLPRLRCQLLPAPAVHLFDELGGRVEPVHEVEEGIGLEPKEAGAHRLGQPVVRRARHRLQRTTVHAPEHSIRPEH